MTEQVANWLANGGKDTVIRGLAAVLYLILSSISIWMFQEVNRLKDDCVMKQDLRYIEQRVDENFRKIEIKIDQYNKAQTERLDQYNKAQTERMDRLIDKIAASYR